MYLIIKWFYSLGKISGIVPEPKLKNWKTEFSREIQEEILHMDSIFQFLSFAYGTIPEHFRRQNWKTEKLRNCFFHGESLPGSLWKKQFFSFSVLLTELFRNISGDKTEKLKNCFFMENLSLDLSGKNSFSVLLTELFRNISGDKTKKLKNCFFMENLSLDVSGKNSFSVFQFCLRKYSGTYHIF